MTTVSTYTREKTGTFEEVTTEVRYTKRSYGGYVVRLASNGRELGWLVKGDNGVWEARVANAAFRGADVDDEGDLLDDVPTYLTHSTTSITGYRPVAKGDTRDDATSDLLYHLHREHSPALGYGRHPMVRAHVSALR